jgi:hypothetical protein
MYSFFKIGSKLQKLQSKLQHFSAARHLELIRHLVFLLKLRFHDLFIDM